VRTKITLGTGEQCGIRIAGFSVRKEHCVLENDDHNNVYLIPLEGAETRVNGKRALVKTALNQNDTLCFGLNSLFYIDLRKPYVRVVYV